MVLSPRLFRARDRLAASRAGRGAGGLSFLEAQGEYSQSLNSSAISSVAYSEQDQTLHITFRSSGRTYTYYEVPVSVYRALVRSASAGRFFNFNIRNRYSYS